MFAFRALFVVMVTSSQMLRGVTASTVCHNPFDQFAECPTDFIFGYTYIEPPPVVSLLDCASRCAQLDTCFSFDYLNNSRPYCGLITAYVHSCLDLYYQPGAKHYRKSKSLCQQPWKLALRHEINTVTDGSVSDLISAIQRGSPVRVLIEFPSTGSSEMILYNVDSVWVANQEVIAQMFVWQYDDASDEVTWVQVEARTSGKLRSAVYNRDYYEDVPAPIRWFVKDEATECGSSSYTVLKYSSMSHTFTEGSFDGLVNAVNQGFPFQLLEKRPDGVLRSYPLVSVSALLDDQQPFSFLGAWLGDSPDIVSQGQNQFTSQVVTAGNGYYFNLEAYTNLDILNRDQQSIRTYVEGDFTWTADSCWEKLYMNDENGLPLYGTQTEFEQRILSGYDIRATYQCDSSPSIHSFTLNKLSILNGLVSGFTVMTFEPKSGTSHLIQTHLHSNGTINSILIDRYVSTEYFYACQARITWFVEKASRIETEYVFPPNEDLIKGQMPRAVIDEGEGRAVLAYDVQKIFYKPLDFYANAFNYRGSNGSSLSWSLLDSRHILKEVSINVLLNSDQTIYAPSYSSPYLMRWFV